MKKLIIALLLSVACLSYAVSFVAVTANVSTKIRTTKEITVLHYDGDNGNNIGSSSVSTLEPAIRLTPTELAAHYGRYLTKIQLFLKAAAYTEVTLKVYEGGTTAAEPGTELCSQPLDLPSIVPDAITDYALNTPVLLEPGKEYWVGYEVVSTPGGKAAGTDLGPLFEPGSGKSNMVRLNGGAWSQLAVLAPSLAYNWNIRAVIESEPGADTTAPAVAAPTGTTAAVGSALTVQTVVTDQTGIASVVGHYKLAGQETWTDFDMNASKVAGTYTGTIPAQSAATTGLVKFTTTDTVTPVNTGDSPEFNITWSSGQWMEWGTEYDAASGVGVSSAPWWAGVDFDFGTTNNWHLTAVKLGVNTAVSAPWNVRSVSQVNADLINLGNIIASGTINCDGISETTPSIAEFADSNNVALTGHVAIVFDMPAASFVSRDIEATSAHTYVAVADDGSLSTLTSLASQFPGAWLAGIRVTSNVGIESAEMLPGKSELSQNYPNPFNPTTAISFYNNLTGNVKLTVINAKGETVATLLNSRTAAGMHKVDFNGTALNSGIYFYKLETPTATITKKMMLIK